MSDQDIQLNYILGKALINWSRNVKPDLIIGPEDDPYLIRWHIRRTGKDGDMYLHQILHDDDDRALHDHPWDSVSVVLQGTLKEVFHEGSRILEEGKTYSRSAETAHRLEVVKGPVWTLFLMHERKREWGFHCPKGWKHWKDYVDLRDSGKIGPGCGE